MLADVLAKFHNILLGWQVCFCVDHKQTNAEVLWILLGHIFMKPGQSSAVNVDRGKPLLILMKCIKEALLTPRSGLDVGVIWFNMKDNCRTIVTLNQAALQLTVLVKILALWTRGCLDAEGCKTIF